MNMTPLNGSNKIVVVGGGAAGMMAAGMAAQASAHVTLLEQNGRPGKKLLITGKGRCNVTNDCAWQDVLQNVPTNPRFLYSALAGFSPADAKAFFEQYGCALKTERGNRVFPVSDRSFDISGALERELRRLHVRLLRERAAAITVENGAVTGVDTDRQHRPADAVILATGGVSYPGTGSTGDGYTFARQCGHTIVPIRPALVPLVCDNNFIPELQGLSLRNVEIRVTQGNKEVYTDFGEMLFTHYGVSGPVVLSASSHLTQPERGVYNLHIDLKPALAFDVLDRRVQRDFSALQNKDLINALGGLLPRKLIPVFVRRSGLEPGKKVNQISREERHALVRLMKDFAVHITDFRPVEEAAIVTAGGVDVRQVSPKTMGSKLVENLYFAGEVLDVDGYTGGFNLQIAFSTGTLCGQNL